MDVSIKLKLIKDFAEEIVTEEELKKLFEKNPHPIAYDGFEPSGRMHIAQGLLRAITVNKLTSLGVRFKFYVADWFAMLNNKYNGDMKKIRTVGEYFIEVWKACGMDLDNVEFIWASEFIKKTPGYWETVLKLSMNSSINRVLRCGQIMGREESTNNPSSQILYPLMQAADIYHLNVDIAQLGMDQRKVNMLARDVFPKLNLTPPVVISHHMLLGLQFQETDKTGIDKKIALKMSKSKPETAIFMTDSKEDVLNKFKKAYCPEGQEEDNPILEYAKYIVFEKFKKIIIKRPEKFGGDITIKDYEELRNLYIKKEIHPLDLKSAIAEYINELLEPIREHFKKSKKAKDLEKKVMSYENSK
jgi:tyrosyl-tRNA synthetase